MQSHVRQTLSPERVWLCDTNTQCTCTYTHMHNTHILTHELVILAHAQMEPAQLLRRPPAYKNRPATAVFHKALGSRNLYSSLTASNSALVPKMSDVEYDYESAGPEPIFVRMHVLLRIFCPVVNLLYVCGCIPK